MKLTKPLSMSILQFFLLILQFLFLKFSASTDTITSTQSIQDPLNIISNDSAIEFGFFSLPNTTNRYVGIVYNIPVITPLWIANRNNHLNDSEGTISISGDGNLVILDGRNQMIWSTNVSSSPNSTTIVAQILNSGNLVLRDNSNGRVLWESFENPTDFFMERMEISDGRNSLTAWKSPFDPSIGLFSCSIDDSQIPQAVILKESQPFWRSGPWNGRIFIGLPDMNGVYLDGYDVVSNREGTTYMTYTYSNDNKFYTRLNYNGTIAGYSWNEGRQDFDITWQQPYDECDIYGRCGPFGICNIWQGEPICTCLKGFEAKNLSEWNAKNFTSGCSRKIPLLGCGNEGKQDGFIKMSQVKVPDFGERYTEDDECYNACLNNCSCVAYSEVSGIGCIHWYNSLIDIRTFFLESEVVMHIRVAYTELDKPRNMKLVIVVTLTIGLFLVFISVYFYWKWKLKRNVSELVMVQEKAALAYHDYSIDSTPQRVKIEEVPLFTYDDLIIATKNFHFGNKLGQGGFGPVYKGKLGDNQEIAVKRLSQYSGQGLDEFINEVVVISKLQHRNLVQLLGCCVEKDEKILVYEYMPNGSLDALLFDKASQKHHLDWPKRVQITKGIVRGLMYLHRDSRLKIIHRDLKPSNILLDKDLNPRISDFGMARIFEGNQDQADTKRVVGTYGYMAPEYAMEGRFSEKSDVFSLGVMLLEIVSGRRNTCFYRDEYALSLLGYAWNLWKEDTISEFIDPNIYEHRFLTEILRYIHVGLLCVQEFSKDRPDVCMVRSMLDREIVDLPILKRPAFTEPQSFSTTRNYEQNQESGSSNSVTLSIVKGR